MKLFELPHLAGRAPPKIAAPCLPQIRAGERIEAARRVEAGGEFIGERLIVNKTVAAG